MRNIWLLALLILIAGCSSPIVWQANHETADLSEWKQDQGDAVFNSGTGTVAVTEALARSGDYALLLRIDDASDQAQGARIFRYAENLDAAYYSAWYYFPQKYDPQRWWNVFQFKSKVEESVPTWVVNVGLTDEEEMIFYMTDHIRDRVFHQEAPRPIPTNEWVHVEAYVRRDDENGRITLWQDGVTLFDFEGVPTSIADNIQWSVNNYTDNITPNDVLIYVDDAAISKTALHK